MASNKVPGSIIGITIGGVWYRCQTDAKLNLTVNTSEDDPCKPEAGAPASADIPWVERSAESRDWNIDFSANLMRDSLSISNPDISTLIIAGTVDVEVQFMTRAGQAKMDFDFVYAGSGIFANFTLNAPVSGNASVDSSIVASGPLTYTKVSIS